jgi:hypothetical protein
MSGLQLQDLRVLATGVGRSRRPYPGCDRLPTWRSLMEGKDQPLCALLGIHGRSTWNPSAA